MRDISSRPLPGDHLEHESGVRWTVTKILPADLNPRTPPTLVVRIEVPNAMPTRRTMPLAQWRRQCNRDGVVPVHGDAASVATLTGDK